MRVRRVIEETGLENSRDSKGGELTAVQERLLSLALELLSDRRILLLDQPFEGLNPSEALQLMGTLQQLSQKKKVTRRSCFIFFFFWYSGVGMCPLFSRIKSQHYRSYTL